MSDQTEQTDVDRAEAAEEALRAFLAERGVSAAALDEVMPVLAEHLAPTIDLHCGVLADGMLTPLYGFRNPVPNDPTFPEWVDYEARWQAAKAAARHYWAIRLSTGWQEA